MDSDARRDHVIIEFLEQYAQDREAGIDRTLGDYLSLFPGCETTIAREYLDARRGYDEPLDRGTRVLGRFEILEEVGRGGQAVVYRARDMRFDRQVALKVLTAGPGMGSEALERMRREAEIASRLDHPGIAVVYDFGRDESAHWIAMRFVEGRTLAALVADRSARTDSVTAPELARMLRHVQAVAMALHAAHEAGIVHRDVKPGNVIVTPDGRPVVLDFGLARDAESAGPTLTATDAVIGTPAYMSPEQLRRDGAPDRGTDIWALGVILYQALTGKLPFPGATFASVGQQILKDVPIDPRRLNPAISRDLAVVAMTALEKERRDRYVTAEALADDLGAALEGRSILARPVGSFTRARRWFLRHPWIGTGATAAVLALITAAALGFMLLGSERARAETDRERLQRIRESADAQWLRQLIAQKDALWPVAPSLVAEIDRWMRSADEALSRREHHAISLAAFRQRRADGVHGGYDDAVDTLIDGLLVGLDSSYEELLAVREVLSARRARACVVRDEHAAAGDAWETCLDALSERRRFRDHDFDAVPGLVPIGCDPDSRCFEFWHVSSGARPERDEAGRLVITEETGIVLVLVPGADYVVGQEFARDGSDPSVTFIRDGYPQEDEKGLKDTRLRLDPFLVSKFEVTQAQWKRMTEGHNPAFYCPGVITVEQDAEQPPTTALHPVERVSRVDAFRVLERHGLTLPSEPQWEYAARAGTRSYWYTGWWPATARGHANVYGAEIPKRLRALGNFEPVFDDGWRVTAPVGSLGANGFGLHDVMGNVWEWSADDHANYDEAPMRDGDGRRDGGSPDTGVLRGGGFDTPVEDCRTASRAMSRVDEASRAAGVRPVWRWLR